MRKSRRYRGGRPGGIGFLIPTLIVLCIVAAVALYVINDNMTFTKDGSFFITEKEEKLPENIETSLEIEVETDNTEAESETWEETETEVVNEGSDEIASDAEKTLFVPIGAVKSEELFAAEIENAKVLGANKLALEVKAEDGTLAFSTATEIGRSTGLAGDSRVLEANVQKARNEGFSVAFFVSCFRDNEAAIKNQEHSVRTGNKTAWTDDENGRWLSPYSAEAKAYIVDVSKELLAFSPDEMIFSNISFPVKGKTETISYEDGGVSKRDAVAAFVKFLAEELQGVKISAVYGNFNGSYIKQSGQKVKTFAEVFQTVYINREGGKYADSIDMVTGLFENPVPIEKTPTSEKFMIRN